MSKVASIARLPRQSNVASYFDERADVYGQQSGWVLDRRVAQAAVDLLGTSPVGDVCDAGGGTGALAHVLMENLDCTTMTLIDESAAMLAHAPRGAQIRHARLEELADEAVFDTLLLRQVLHYIDQPGRVLRRLQRALRDDGRLYIGQLVAPSGAAARWLASIANQVSATRRRVYTADKLLTVLTMAGFHLNCASIAGFSDDVRSLATRGVSVSDESVVVDYARSHANASLARVLRLDLESETLPYELLWFHGVFSR